MNNTSSSAAESSALHSIPIYVVSLKKDIERRKEMGRQFSKLGLDFSFVDACLGRELLPTELAEFNFGPVRTRKGRDLTAGEIGCTVSHQRCYEKLQSSGADWAIILEDDVILDERFVDFYHSLRAVHKTSSLDSNSIYLLGGQEGLPSNMKVVLSYWNQVSIGRTNFRRSVSSEQFIYRTCCYLINVSLAAKLRELYSAEFFVADEWAYFCRIGSVSSLYLSNFVRHPIDLHLSNLERERIEADALRNTVAQKSSLIGVLKSQLRVRYIKRLFFRMRAISLGFIYR